MTVERGVQRLDDLRPRQARSCDGHPDLRQRMAGMLCYLRACVREVPVACEIEAVIDESCSEFAALQ